MKNIFFLYGMSVRGGVFDFSLCFFSVSHTMGNTWEQNRNQRIRKQQKQQQGLLNKLSLLQCRLLLAIHN